METDVATLIARISAERDLYLENLTACQRRCTELVEENRHLLAREQFAFEEYSKLNRAHVPHHVAAFMDATNTLPTQPTPHIPDEATLRLRLKLVAEEFFELMDACDIRYCLSDYDQDAIDVTPQELVFNGLDGIRLELQPGGGQTRPDLPALCDALADLDYVIEGFRLACGVDGGPIAAEVHRSNMSKLPATKNADGKVVKGPNYSPPDIAGELRKQGWGGC